jgi:integrase
MARTLRDANLGTREARLRLAVRSKPYYRLIEDGLHLGYRRLGGRSGTWCVRRYVGAQSYAVEALDAVADDFADADGKMVMSFKQAQRAVLASKPRPDAGAPTVANVIRQYLEYLSDHGKATYSDSKYRAEALIIPTLGNVPAAALTSQQLRVWLAALARTPGRHTQKGDTAEGQRRRKATANRTLVILRAALNLAFREGHVPADGAWRRVRPFRGVDTARVRALTLAEAQRLINASDPDFRRLVQGALATGCRFGELCNLRVADFNADSDSVRVRHSKSGKPRDVFLTAEGVTLFRRWTAGRRGDDHLLTRDGKPWRPNDQTRPMLLACKRAGIEPAAGFHITRHSYATLAVKKGTPLLVLAKNLGHRDTRMVELHYANLAQSYVASVIRDTAPTFGVAAEQTNIREIRSTSR